MSDVLIERLLDRDIVVFRFYKSTRQATDEYLHLVEDYRKEFIEKYTVEQTMFYVIDVSRSGMFSVNYATRKMSELLTDKTQIPKSYIAYVIGNPADKLLFDVISGVAARQTTTQSRKVFMAEQYDDAIDWLLSIREDSSNMDDDTP